jgi:hypothetical protein
MKRLYEVYLGEQREWVGRQLLSFEAMLEKQDLREIAQLRTQLVQTLDRFEGKVPL